MKNLWALQANSPIPEINTSDLRFNPLAWEIENNNQGLTLLARIDNKENQYLLQLPNGEQQIVDEKFRRYSSPKRGIRDSVVRIFISSTFKDMEAERSYLVKMVLPRLKSHAKRYGIVLQEVDLRWGVTEEEAARGETIDICLNEIEKCKTSPLFFIGLLGERYGWIPEESQLNNSEENIEFKSNVPPNTSVTEMEIQFGVFENTDLHSRSLFYIRSKELTGLLSEFDSESGDIYFDKDNQLIAKQNELKKKLDQLGVVRINGYNSVEQFGSDVEQVIFAAIERLSNSANSIRTQRNFNENFYLESVQENKEILYLNNELINLERLPNLNRTIQNYSSNTQIKCEKHIIFGESGIGKTFEAFRISNVIFGSIFVNLSNRLFFTQTQLLGYIHERIGNDISAIEGNTLQQAVIGLEAITKPTLIVIDDIDTLTEYKQFIDSINTIRNPNCFFILTASQSQDTFNNLEGWATHNIQALSDKEVDKFINSYLEKFRKKINQSAVLSLANNPISKSPLGLKLALEDLRKNAKFETLVTKIQNFPTDLTSLFQEQIDLFLSDLSSKSKEKIIDLMIVLSLAKYGIAEELILSEEGLSITQYDWALFKHFAVSILRENIGVFNLSSNFFKKAILDKYSQLLVLKTESFYRKLVIRYFKNNNDSLNYLEIFEQVTQSLWLIKNDTSERKTALDHLFDVLSSPRNIANIIHLMPEMAADAWKILIAEGYSIDTLNNRLEKTPEDYSFGVSKLLKLLSIQTDLLGNITSKAIQDNKEFASYEDLLSKQKTMGFKAVLGEVLKQTNDWYIDPLQRHFLPPLCFSILIDKLIDKEVTYSPGYGKYLDQLSEVLKSEHCPAEKHLMFSSGLAKLLEFENPTVSEEIAKNSIHKYLKYIEPQIRILHEITITTPLVNALSAQGKNDEAINIGLNTLNKLEDASFSFNTLKEDTSDSVARLSRAIGHALISEAKWIDAERMFSLALNSITSNDMSLRMICLGFKAICQIEQDNYDDAFNLIDEFVSLTKNDIETAIQVKQQILIHLNKKKLYAKFSWLEFAF